MVNTFTESIWPTVRNHPWKYEPRSAAIDILLVHATRSGIPGRTSAQEYVSTKSWFMSEGNDTDPGPGRGSAGMTNRIIGDGGKLCIALPDEFYPTWSAGHMDPRALSYELAQATNDTPYDPLDVERLEHELANDCRRLGIPAKHIAFMDGNNSQAPGIAYHDASRNGVILGKSDPGKMPPFNAREAWVRDRIAPLVTGDEPMTPQEKLEFEQLKRAQQATQDELTRTRWSYLTYVLANNKRVDALGKHTAHPPNV